MTTYSSISNTALAVGAVPSSSVVTALRDNPIATAEQASGSPVIVNGWHPVDKVSIGDGKQGLIYDVASNGTVADVVTPDFEDGYEYRLVGSGISHNSGVDRSFQIALYKQTAASYVTAFSDSTRASSVLFDFDIHIMMPRITALSHFVTFLVAINTGSFLLTTTSGYAYNATAQKILKARIQFGGGSIDAGKIWLMRRREFASAD